MNKPSVPLAFSLAALFAGACGGPMDAPDESSAEPTSNLLAIVGLAETSAELGVTARGDDGNVPANVLDGDLSTRWSCEGVGCWIRADLGEQRSVTGVGVAWFVGDERVSNFTISVSSDDSAYKQVFEGKSSGTTLQLEPYAISATQARYVKLTVNGNSDSDWASVTELQVFGAAPTSYVGCYTDGATRALPKVLAWSNATVESCIAAAKSQSFAYAGLQYGGECRAGNTLGAAKVADSECAMPCTANSSEVCGGPWRNSVYSTASGSTTCTSFTYSDWGPCQANTHRRTILSQAPAGCAGGAPILSGTCGYNGWTTSAWKTRFDAAYPGQLAGFKGKLSSADDTELYYFSAIFDAQVSAYLAFHDARYIEDMLSLVESWMRTAANHGDGYLGWSVKGSVGPGWTSHGESTLCDSNAWRFVTRLLRVIRTTPALYSAYGNRYKAILAFTERNIFQKWYARGPNSANAWILGGSVTNMNALWGMIAYDLTILSRYGDTDPNWRAHYDSVWKTVAARLRQALYMTGSNPTRYAVHSRGSSAVDLPHANQVLSMVVEQYEGARLELGPTFWTPAEIQGLADNLRLTAWKNGTWTAYMDGTGGTSGNQNLLGIMASAAAMARFDLAHLQPVMEQFATVGGSYASSAFFAAAANNLTAVK
jgi:hypothetical protein